MNQENQTRLNYKLLDILNAWTLLFGAYASIDCPRQFLYVLIVFDSEGSNDVFKLLDIRHLRHPLDDLTILQGDLTILQTEHHAVLVKVVAGDDHGDEDVWFEEGGLYCSLKVDGMN